MAYIPGSIPVTGFIGPTDDSDVYAVTDAIYGIDGYRSLSSTTVRNAITTERRREGMLVYTQNDQNVWQLLPSPWTGTDSDWKLFISSGITALLTASTVGEYLPLSGGSMYGDINMSSTTVIKSTNGGGQIELDVAGTPNEVVISNDNGTLANAFLYLFDNGIQMYAKDPSIGVYNALTIESTDTHLFRNTYNTPVRISTGGFGPNATVEIGIGAITYHHILMADNLTAATTSDSVDRASIFIGSKSSKFNSGVTNSVIIGGGSITATTNNTLYTQKIALKESSDAPLNIPIFTSDPVSLTDGDTWITSGSTGNALLNIRIGGVTKTVELT